MVKSKEYMKLMNDTADEVNVNVYDGIDALDCVHKCLNENIGNNIPTKIYLRNLGTFATKIKSWEFLENLRKKI
jgi:hypothetical protein